MSNIVDPAHVGCGIWFCLHILSLLAVDSESKKDYARKVKYIISSMRCDTCRVHALEYLQKNPVESFFNIKDKSTGAELGCFKWSYIFHNTVNKRLHKREVPWDEAILLFTSGLMDKHCPNCQVGNSVLIKNKSAKVVSRFST